MTTVPATTPVRYRVATSRRWIILAVLAGMLAGYAAVVSAPPANAVGENLAQGRPATASSIENAATPASAAFDGNPATRWSSAFSDPQWLQVDLGSTQWVQGIQLRWESAYASAFRVQISSDAVTWSDLYSTSTGHGGIQVLNVNGTGRYLRMLGTARATGYGYSLWEFQAFTGPVSDPPPCQSASAALNHPATASSLENSATPASAAVDGDLTTRWSSAFSDPQWLQVDLGSQVAICQVAITWEAAYGSAFQIQVSDDGTSWSTISSTAGGTGSKFVLHTFVRARYVRMYGTARATRYGYSIRDFGVNLLAI